MAFDPDFATNQFVYVYYTATTPRHPQPGQPLHRQRRRRRWPGSEIVLLDLDNLSSATNHNGGAIHFGPDGKLYVAVGENANGANAQTLTNLLGKMLRINADGTIPTDNPFFNTATGNNRAIWALGLRNPFTFAFQPGTGRMFINDVGQNTWEEINDGIAGANYGWPDTEGPTTNPARSRRRSSPTATAARARRLRHHRRRLLQPGTAQFPAPYVGQLLLRRLLQRLDPPLRPGHRAPPTAFATGASEPGRPAGRAPTAASTTWRAAAGAVWQVELHRPARRPRSRHQPASQTVTVGQPRHVHRGRLRHARRSPTSGSATASNIAGATAATYTLAPRAARRQRRARSACVVTQRLRQRHQQRAPRCTVTRNTPADGDHHRARAPARSTPPATTINYAGTGTDPEDGTLPAERLHLAGRLPPRHAHPSLRRRRPPAPPAARSPSRHRRDRDQRLVPHPPDRARLGRADAHRRSATSCRATVDAHPGHQPARPAAHARRPARRHAAAIAERGRHAAHARRASRRRPAAGRPTRSQSWSDGGAATHTIATPATNTTYTATFTAEHGPAAPACQGYYFDNQDFTGTHRHRRRSDRGLQLGHRQRPSPASPPTPSPCAGPARCSPKVTETHTFYTTSDDGVRLWVNDVLVIDNWTDHAATENSGTIALTAGQKYASAWSSTRTAGSAVARLSWSAPGPGQGGHPAGEPVPVRAAGGGLHDARHR